MTKPSSNSARRAQRQAGFTLLEAVVAISVLTVGLLGVAAAIAYSVATTGRSRGVTEAKQIVLSTLEQVSALRDAERLTYAQISNRGVDNFSGFVATFRPVTTDPGPDGIHGSADDATTDNDPANDTFERSIVISELNPNLKKIEVTVKYRAGGHGGELTGVGYMNNDARPTYRR